MTDQRNSFIDGLLGRAVRERERKAIFSQNRSDAGVRSSALSRANEVLLYLLLVCAFTLGGSAGDASVRIFVICLVASITLPVALLAGAWGAVWRLPFSLRIALILIPLVPALQLVPLPPAMWEALPGRDVPKAVFDLVAARDVSHPLTLSPSGTMLALLMLLPPYAALFAASLLDEKARERCVALFLMLVVVSILVGVIQMGSAGATFNFYNSAHSGNLIGFFANRNHEGAMLAVGAIFAIAFVNSRAVSRQSAIAWTAVLSITFLATTIGTTSRAALGLMLLGLIVSVNIYFIKAQGKRRVLWGLGAIVAVAAMVYLLSFSTVVTNALARFNDVAENGRGDIWRNSWPLVGQYFPWGSGIGTFVPAYAAREPLDQVNFYYTNSPHNEYLGILIEMGLPGIVVLGVFAAAIVVRGVKLLRSPEKGGTFALPAGLAILLLALHSIVDYPLRTPAWIVVFAVLITFFFSAAEEKKKRVRVRAGRETGQG